MRSYELYGPDHPMLPQLVGDIALHWNVQGHYRRTLPIFLALRDRFREPSDRIRAAAGIARAAGSTGNRELFFEGWNELWRLADVVNSGGLVAGTLYEGGIGAANLYEMELATQAFTRALALATATKTAGTAAQAEAALARIARGEAPDPAPARRRTVPSGRPADALAQEFIQSLKPEPVHSR